jgi:hypothetical protein
MANADCEGKLGMSVCNISVTRLLDHFTKEILCQEIENFMKDRELSMFGITCDVHEKETGRRFIMMYSTHKDSFGRSLEMLVEKINSDETVQAIDCVRGSFHESTFAHWEIKNLSLSRKKYEAFLKTIYDK